MEREEYSTNINASPEKVWRVLWGEDTYPDWTSYFGEGSHAESDWEEGSRILFLNSKNEGMISRIAKKDDNRYMSFEHLGMRDAEGNEDLESEKVKPWAGAFENYTLEEEEGNTRLTVELDIEEDYKESFGGIFPKALRRIKELSEDKTLS